MAASNVILTALIIGGIPIPLSGDGTGAMAVLTHEDITVVAPGVVQAVRSAVVNPGATLTISCYPQDPAYRILWGIAQRQLVGLGLVELPGSYSSPEITKTWLRCQVVSLPDINRESAPSSVSFSFHLDGLGTVVPA